jgi:DNA polymerase V
MRSLDRIYKTSYNFAKGGVMVSDIVPETEAQANLFDHCDRQANNNLMAALDKLNKPFGKDVVQVAARGQRKNWLMRADYKSLCYTTRLGDLLTVSI